MHKHVSNTQHDLHFAILLQKIVNIHDWCFQLYNSVAVRVLQLINENYSYWSCYHSISCLLDWTLNMNVLCINNRRSISYITKSEYFKIISIMHLRQYSWWTVRTDVINFDNGGHLVRRNYADICGTGYLLLFKYNSCYLFAFQWIFLA